MLEAMVPVSDRSEARRNIDRLDLLIKSLNFFWHDAEPLVLNVVVPDDEIDKFRARFAYAFALENVKFKLISETSVSPIISSIRPEYGILKQMLLKLICFSFCQADFCLILDSDIVACKFFGAADLIRNGRALTEWYPPDSGAWWRESARVLGFDLTPEDFSRRRMFVTPQILSKKIIAALTEKLSESFGCDWLLGLIAEYSGKHPDIWTEYTLYDLFADRMSIMEKYHLPFDLPDASVRLHCMDQSIWQAEHFEHWDPAVALQNETAGYFMVLQSITANQVDFDKIRIRWLAAASAQYSNYVL
jgi:hypothetical protein